MPRPGSFTAAAARKDHVVFPFASPTCSYWPLRKSLTPSAMRPLISPACSMTTSLPWRGEPSSEATLEVEDRIPLTGSNKAAEPTEILALDLSSL